MARMSLFDSPFLLGFDQFERALDRVSKASSDGYPPYNVEQVGPEHLRITLAVAGFGADDLAVTVVDNQLVIAGQQAEEPDRVYIHRGIAARQFKRAFVLADGIEVESADLSDGLLNVTLVRPVVEKAPRSIHIRAGAPAGDGRGRALNVTNEGGVRR